MNSIRTLSALDNMLQPSRVSAALLGERQSRRVGTEQGLAQPAVPQQRWAL